MVSLDEKHQKRRRKGFSSQEMKEMLSGYLYISPFFIIFAIIGLYPAIFSLILAFQKWNGMGEMEFVGLSNFQVILSDPLFWKSVYNTIILGLMGTAPQLVIGLILAFLLNLSYLRFKAFFRVTIFMPYITSMVAVALVFSVFFSNNETALVNYIIGLFGFDPVSWKTSEWGAKIAISTMVFWRWLGYNTIIYLAGMQSIPNELYEASRIDGASIFQQLRYITIPLLKPFIILTVFFSTVGAMQLFTEPTVFLGNTAFARDEAMTVVMYLYRDAFRLSSFGTASAAAIVLLLFIVVASAFNMMLTKRLGKDGGKHV
ncbi:sugar ABC transporter permease [Psychrobacillus psychrodurans]|jgi:cellobiose transport system permease protein|uniref:carbohydrate ABC transporter permease n=1 Tax=Psychrobacillus TaxID=1221880 RepID=UPI0008E8CE69|nr:sugar ABC transporter permease [Psychrobacillus psychrodurans]MCK1998532.1 sugar ABC transporter permease [Psychrobacillus psychrodurans]MCZ8540332.1 sugar ABC transporter permease [Psychrobacillus psychrodurans]SFM60232.1 cellobiose transport system permease protein [Psychrobacillus psychrodurans]